MVSFGETAKIKKAENLNQGRSYVITTVPFRTFLILQTSNWSGTIFCRFLQQIGSKAGWVAARARTGRRGHVAVGCWETHLCNEYNAVTPLF